MLKKIILGPFAAFFSLLSNPLGWLVLGVGGYFIYTSPSTATYLIVIFVWGIFGVGLMPRFSQPHSDKGA